MNTPGKDPEVDRELQSLREFMQDGRVMTEAEAAALRETGTPLNIDGIMPIRRDTNERTFTLERTGDLPLTFTGEQLTHAAPGEDFRERWLRWFELSVYRTKGGKYVCAMEYHTSYKNESSIFQAEIIDGDDPAEECAEVFAHWGDRVSCADDEGNPPYVIGWPEGSLNHQRRQAPMLRAMENHWDAMMGQALKVPGFAERVD